MKGQAALGLAFVLLIFPFTADAVVIIPDNDSALKVEHGGILIEQNPSDPPTINGADLNAVDSNWKITLVFPWISEIPAERGWWGIFRGTFGNLDGGPAILGENYSFVNEGAAGEGSTTIEADFTIPALGDPSTPSERYTIVVADKLVTKNIYDEDGNIAEEVPYTDADLIKWFETGGAEGVAPYGYEFLEFNYIAGTPPPPPCAADCFSNVLFLPGIEASRLYRPQVVGSPEKKVWEPGINDDLHALHLNSEGKNGFFDVYAKEGDVIDETVIGTNIYKSFIAKMDDLKNSGAINDWEAAAYDWRLSLQDIVNGGSLIDGEIYYAGPKAATSTPYILQQLRHLAATSKSGKVTIIAHSNGGLVAKKLTQVLGSESSDLIDRIIFVAVPQVGTPDAIAQGLHGEPIGAGIFASKAAVRAFASTSPMLYHLLPSEGYFSSVNTPVVSFDSSLPGWAGKYGDSIISDEKLGFFLADGFGRVDAETGDTNQPIQLDDDLFLDAVSVHQALDNWNPPAGVELIQIAGWGVPSTVSGITYKKKGDGVQPEPTFTIDGDGTVVVPSALWTSTTAGAVNYWVDLNTYNNKRLFRFGPFVVDHADILEINELLDFLVDTLEGDSRPLPSYTYLSSTSPPSTQTRLIFSLHSPLTLDLFDDQGRHTGMSTTTGEVETQIPGTYYQEFGEIKYIFADSDAVFRIVLQGYDTGTFTFVVNELEGDVVISSTAFEDIPVNPQTRAIMDVSNGIGVASNLSVDENGDGSADFSYASSTGELIVLPPPSVPAVSPPLISGGGGGIPSLLTQVTSTATTASTTSPTLSEKQEQTVQLVQPKRIVNVNPQKKAPTATTTKKEAQVAGAAKAMVPKQGISGLWSRISEWIIRKLSL